MSLGDRVLATVQYGQTGMIGGKGQARLAPVRPVGRISTNRISRCRRSVQVTIGECDSLVLNTRYSAIRTQGRRCPPAGWTFALP